MIKKLLIANRGEIAVRIIRACAEMGITSVAIYTDADRYALHVKQADESYNIGKESLAGYLNAHSIINLAKATKCDAIHPGYGFLSENPILADCCMRQGIIFVGPNADIIKVMGDKVEARKKMQAAGLPVLPGSDGNIASLAEALNIAADIGYPIMLKATAGGGGRGIRMCPDAAAVKLQYERVRSEVEKAFGNPEIFIEKFVTHPRHLEVQILADHHHNVVHLFERDCSIQRRNQKLIEIAPSPQICSDTRARLCALGVKAATYVNYQNAGTVEFLFDEQENIYFLEMNTRLQVEHTVTEQITGIDIVQEQIRIADNHPLSFKQADIQYRGYAMQMRINAEDTKNNFLPSFGRVTRYYAPGGPGVRTDSAIYTGYQIPPYYDSLCAKVTVWALTWPMLITRGLRALSEMKLYGIQTTIQFYQEILNHIDFQQAKLYTDFIDNHSALTQYSSRSQPRHVAAVIAAVIAVYQGV